MARRSTRAAKNGPGAAQRGSVPDAAGAGLGTERQDQRDEGKTEANHPKKIAIVGCYPETWDKAPFDDTSWEIWGFSRRNMGKLPRCDRWFELHDPMMWEGYERDVHGYKDYLKEPNVTTIEKFPKQDLEARFGSFFFSSGQVPWLFAYAISLEPKEIGLWGIEALDSYMTQRYDVQHFAQECHDSGINLVIPEGCTILTARKSYI